MDTKNAPPVDNDQIITDSNCIVGFLSRKYNIDLDDRLTENNLHFLVTRILDNHLYLVIPYSRWQDERFWPLFKAEFLKQFPQFSEDSLTNSRNYNIEKYQYHGISHYSQEDVYQSGIEDFKNN
ncbi:hypothetical protein [Legionella brunensis]|uniref:hypothetical protein n=1 Tax=Legionella brunensis TaxID=29422 RepID=UPI001EE6B022|nr:hypothetical protein [Legionella brunensis]